MHVNVGDHLIGAVDGVEVIVVRPSADDVDLRYRGLPLLATGVESTVADQPLPPGEPGLLLGKRYVDAVSGLELLCVKPGPGTVSVGERLLQVKSAAQLPASD